MNRRLVAIALLIAGAALFAIGTSIEKSRHHDEPAAAVEGSSSEAHNESSESTTQRQAETTESRSQVGESGEGKILGIDRESTGLVVLAVIVSLALAALLLRPTRAAWLITSVIALAFAVFDIAEIIHQIGESAAGLAALAAAVALAHITTTGIAATELRYSPAQ